MRVKTADAGSVTAMAWICFTRSEISNSSSTWSYCSILRESTAVEMAAVFSFQICLRIRVVPLRAVISEGLSRYLKIRSLISGGRSEKVTGALSGFLNSAGTIVSASSEATLAAELVTVVSSGTA